MPRLPDIPGLTDFVQIGEGGNGVVYRAMQAGLRRVVAVKLLSARLDSTAADRFAREGQALGLVSGHPNIVPVYSADTTSDGEPYLVMQLCEGGSLADRVEGSGPMPWQQVLDLGVRISGALQTAHDAGLLHRDIKPGNILFDGYGVPLLADFGQAQHADAHLTKTGDVVATPGFAAPEVLTGSKATVRSDVYSLASTMLAAILGYAPFSRDTDENVAATLLRVLQDAPPDVRPLGVPEPLAQVLERAMSKQPGMRPMSAAEFGRELQRVQRELGLPVTQMIVPPKPDSTTPFTPMTAPTMVESDRPRASTAPLGPDGPPPGATAHQGASAGGGRRTGRWIAIGLVLALLVAGGVWAGIALLGAREPKNVTSASDLLIGGEDYGEGTWETTEDISLLTNTLGTTGDDISDPSPSNLSECLGLDFSAMIDDAKASAQYVDTSLSSPDEESPSAYRYGRTVSIVANSAGDAEQFVTAFASPTFDTCLDATDGLGANIGEESTSYSNASKISVPEFDPSPPDSVSYQLRQVAVPLSSLSDGTESSDDTPAGYRYVTFVAMAAGTSVDIVVFQSSEATLADSAYEQTYEAFLDAATQ
ncbi:protein kinase [Epidermidibacterium keratini]|uniref:non-specific serine/threonine protein kinase n=1 Tax=Epidermidibacterium keratini TaxID=1891644 RepID=A0A7L4YLB1_9ACTN|nr:serine/threonine-protein kinase [Epidermidibacterium keratini]QHB99623.1 protein kinase [Epidermidibacterium keratini]